MNEATNTAGYIPLKYYRDFIAFVARHPDIRILTYADLQWGNDSSYQDRYASEFENWKQNIREPMLIDIIIQHDLDAQPENTKRVLELERDHGVRSNTMIFVERVDKQYFNQTGDIRSTPYPIDHQFFLELQDEGFVFGYHQNALERADFDMTRALQLMKSDLQHLSRKGYNVQFFSPHGGCRGPLGEVNHQLELDDELRRQVKWVANKHTLRIQGGYSDGGLNSTTRDPNDRDLRDFVRTMQRGCRYRVLTHPQYYSNHVRVNERLSEAAWYVELLRQCSETPKVDTWQGVTV